MNPRTTPSRGHVRSAFFVAALLTSTMLHAHAPPPVRAPSLLNQDFDAMTFDISPMAPADSLLRYRLQHPPSDRTAGNAATLYLQALLFVEGTPAFDEQVETLRDLEDDAFTAAYEAAFGERLGGSLELMLIGSTRAACDWSLPIRELGQDTLLPELNPAHSMAVRVQQVARYHVARGNYARAVEFMRVGMTFARHVADQGPLVSGLVGAGIDRLMLTTVADTISRDDAPNLYWALRALPRWQDRIPSLWATDLSLSMHPLGNLDEIRQGKLSLDKQSAHQMLARIGHAFSMPTTAQSPVDTDQLRDGLALLREPAIEHFVKTRAVRRDEAERLEPEVLAVTYVAESMVADLDELSAIATLSYPELDRRLAAIESRPETSPFSMSRVLAPTLRSSLKTFVKGDQHIAALTTIEALRAHAAAHGGQLPSSLDQMTDTPAPLNPATGRPFEYGLDDGVATLEDSTSPWPLRYTIRLRLS